MRLSDAIRLGSMLRPKASGMFFSESGTCAQGAALEAVGVTCVPNDWVANWELRDEMRRLWPWLKASASCPACGVITEGRAVLSHLNNDNSHGWTRERIADWVATVEPGETTGADASNPTNAVARTVEQGEAVHSR